MYVMLTSVVNIITFFLSPSPGEVTKHGDVKYILNEGMPQYKNPFEKGRLIIQFVVNFPSSLPAEIAPQLENCLPAR
jgi:DnaJ family protein A protein 1